MNLSFLSLRDWLHATLVDHARVQDEASAQSLQRFRIFALLAMGMNLCYLAYFWFWVPAATTPQLQRYNQAIGSIHLVCALGLAMLLPWVHMLHGRTTQHPLAARLLQWVVSAWTVLFGIALSVADQWVGSNTTNYVMVCLLIAMLALLRPLASLLLFALAYTLLYLALGRTQADPAMLDMARSHSFSGTVLSMAAAIVMWRQYVTAALLRRALTRTNASLEAQQKELAYLATHDTLTGLRNRRAFWQEAEHELSRAQRYPCETGLLVADLDHYKHINDHYGHPAGDAVLQHFAQRLRAQLRECDVPARLGGEEFIVLLPGTGADGTAVVAEKIRQALQATPIAHASGPIAVTVSIGVSSLPAYSSCTLEALYAQADEALYAAKAAGHNRVVLRPAPAPQ